MPEQDPSLRYMLSELSGAGRKAFINVQRLRLLEALTTLDNLQKLHQFDGRIIPVRKQEFITSFSVEKKSDTMTHWHYNVRHLDNLDVPLRQSSLYYSFTKEAGRATLFQNDLSVDDAVYNATIYPLEQAEPDELGENFRKIRRFSVGLTTLAREAIRSSAHGS